MLSNETNFKNKKTFQHFFKSFQTHQCENLATIEAESNCGDIKKFLFLPETTSPEKGFIFITQR